MCYAIARIEGVNIEFRPCPFCGGMPEWVEVPGEDYIMRCSDCHASTPKARMTVEGAAADWNAQNIANDNYTITMDRKIDDYLQSGIKNVFFDEYSPWEDYPSCENGFLCSAAVIVTDKMIIRVDPEWHFMVYDELCRYEQGGVGKAIAEENEEVHFEKSQWEQGNLVTLRFRCENKVVIVSADERSECMAVREISLD